MRSLKLRRNRALLVSAVAAGMVIVGVTFAAKRGTEGWPDVVAVSGAAIGTIALFVAGMRQIDVARCRRMLRGEGVIATWTVDAEQWRRFRERNREWENSPRTGPNLVDVWQEPLSGGLVVAVSDNGLLVGADFHSIDRNARVKVYGSWMEFDTVMPRSDGGSEVHLFHRFPVAPGSEGAAWDVERFYSRTRGKAASNPRTRIYLAAAFVGGPVVFAAMAWWFG